MKTVNLIQGSPEWLAHRAQHFNASDAPAMLGLSPYKTRTELIRERATGLTADVGAAKQRIFDMGHRSERLARPLAEKIIGEELSPLVGVADDGPYSSSYDGLTLMEDQAFEHKALNDRLRAAMVHGCTGADLPDDYQVQMEHQCLTNPSIERVLFMASKWTEDGELIEERHCWYTPNPVLRARIVAGWAQLDQDVKSYVPVEQVVEVVGRAPETLPALHVVLKGEVSSSNLAEFKEVALTAIRSVNRDLKTDQDFANSAKARKWCEDIETRVAAAKEHALGQTASIDLLFRTMDEVSAEAREVRLALEKLEKARKESRRGEIVAGGVKALADHITALNTRLGKPYMPSIPADFGAAIKNLRTFDSMQNAVDSALANAKIAASAAGDRIQANLATLREHAAEHAFLFPDTAQIVQKAPEDLTTLVKARIAEHQEKERARLEAERERIRTEEQAKAKSDADAAIAASTAAAAPTTAPAPPAPALTPAPVLEVIASAPAANESAPGMPPTLSIGGINERLKYFAVTAEALRGLGFEPAGRERAAPRYHEHQFPGICEAVAKRALLVRQDYLQPHAA